MPNPVTVTIDLTGSPQQGPDVTFENYVTVFANVAASPYVCKVSADPTLATYASIGYAPVTFRGRGNLNQFYIQGGTSGDTLVFFGV
jgi:hypothetical protein